MLRTVLALALLLPSIVASAAEFQFDVTGVTATGVTPSAMTYWICACTRTVTGSQLYANRYGIVPDADGDGVVRWELGSSMMADGLWIMIDGGNGSITSRRYDGTIVAPSPFPAKAFLHDENGVYSRFIFNVADVPYDQFQWVFWVRPGVGMWGDFQITSQSPFDEHSSVSRVMMDVSGLRTGATPAAPAGVEAGDWFLVVDQYARGWFGDRVDAHLAETLGPGVLEIAGFSGDEDAKKIAVKLVRVEGTGGAASVHMETSNGTAIAGTHYTASSGSVVFAPGQIFATFDVPVIDDSVDSGTPSFRATISNPTGAALGSVTQANIGILDNDDTPIASIEAKGVTEGDDGPQEVPVRVTLDHTAPKPATLEWRAYDRFTNATLQTGTVDFAIGEKEKSIAIRYVADDLWGGGQWIYIEKKNVTNLICCSGQQGQLRIVEDETRPAEVFHGSVVWEADATAQVTVGFAAPLAIDYPVSFRTVARSAANDDDFTPMFGAVLIPKGSLSAIINIPIRNDAAAETTESFDVELTYVIGVAPSVATVTILDDDGARRRRSVRR